jgi:hypothetical protein
MLAFALLAGFTIGLLYLPVVVLLLCPEREKLGRRSSSSEVVET